MKHTLIALTAVVLTAAVFTLTLEGAPAAPAAPANQPVRFADATGPSGIKFVHNSGKAGKKLLPETMGSGVVLFDADGDGWLDAFFVNGRNWKPGARKSTQAFYRNNRNGTFTDASKGSGLDIQVYGMGATAGDYDNDGKMDLYLTALEGDRLFRNLGNGKFQDVTAASGIKNANFGTSAAWVDYDKDGRLDLFVANYVQWSEDKDLWCSLDGATKSYCTPESYKGTSSKLYRNVGGKFEDVSQRAGVAGEGKALGVAILDFNMDGWSDIFVANDTQPNKLYRNLKDGRFVDEGMESGVAFSEEGVARGAMGVDAADYDRSGRPHLLVGNFSNEMLALYHNEGSGVFVDDAPASTVGRSSLLTLAFGVFFFDYDLDGFLDIFSANGHIEEEINRVQPRVQYRQPPLLFRNQGKGKFEHVKAGQLEQPLVARGAAYGDLDRDGDLDLVITNNHGPAKVFRNEGGNRNRWLQIRTVGAKSNRDGIGAIVRVTSASGKQWGQVRSGSSYCSQSDLALTFGLGKDPGATAIEIDWPSGAKQKLGAVPGNQILVIEEGKGIVSKAGPAK
ncbi:MAG TPA: CRTAC1 family protein [Thermoanaerobaculia bacterium]|nr:CRTAC1 family protein [Thermoanaerobaculia bacterium]